MDWFLYDNGLRHERVNILRTHLKVSVSCSRTKEILLTIAFWVSYGVFDNSSVFVNFRGHKRRDDFSGKEVRRNWKVGYTVLILLRMS